MKDVKISSTGGMIQFKSNGLVHTCNRGAYSGRHAEEGTEVKVYDAPKRGRGRPRKDESRYDFSAFLSDVALPKWTGQSRVYQKLEDVE